MAESRDERREGMTLRERAALARAPKPSDRPGVGAVKDIAGKIWNGPNTALGLAYGLTGFLVKRIDEDSATPLPEAGPSTDVATQGTDVDDQDLRKTA